LHSRHRYSGGEIDGQQMMALRRVNRQHIYPVCQILAAFHRPAGLRSHSPTRAMSNWECMNNFSSPTMSISAIPTTAHVQHFSTLGYAHVTVKSTAVEPSMSAVACRCEAQTELVLQDGEHRTRGGLQRFSPLAALRDFLTQTKGGRQRLHRTCICAVQ
jgi:hypothetical protein